MTSINFHASYNGKLQITAEAMKTVNGTKWVEIKILEGTREIGEIVVYDATDVEVLETAR